MTMLVREIACGGSGAVDAQPLIQQAINDVNAAGGGVLKLGPGTYVLNNPLTLYSNVSLTGAGMGLTVLDFSNYAATSNVISATGTVSGAGIAISTPINQGDTTVSLQGWAWQPGHLYAANTIIIAGTPGMFFVANNSGTSGGGAGPTWPPTVGATVLDNGVTWIAMSLVAGSYVHIGSSLFGFQNGGLLGEIALVKSFSAGVLTLSTMILQQRQVLPINQNVGALQAAAWQASHAYALNSVVSAGLGNAFYTATAAGTSAAAAPPWPNRNYSALAAVEATDVLTDNTVTWTSTPLDIQAYPVSGTSVNLLLLVTNVTLKDLTVRRNSSAAQGQGAFFTFCNRVRVQGVQFQYCTERAVHLQFVVDGEVSGGCSIEDTYYTGTGTSYGVAIADACSNIRVLGNFFRNFRHGVSVGNGGGSLQGIPRLILVSGNTFSQTNQAAGAQISLDAHEGTQWVTYHGNTVLNSVYDDPAASGTFCVVIRGFDCVVADNVFYGHGGILVTNAGNAKTNPLILGNRIFLPSTTVAGFYRRGILIQCPGGAQVIGNRVDGATDANAAGDWGISLGAVSGWIDDCLVDDNYVVGGKFGGIFLAGIRRSRVSNNRLVATKNTLAAGGMLQIRDNWDAASNNVEVAGNFFSTDGDPKTPAAPLGVGVYKNNYGKSINVTFSENTFVNVTQEYSYDANSANGASLGRVGTTNKTQSLTLGVGTYVTQYAGSGVPTAGKFNIGDIVWNTAPVPGGPSGWVCTTAGSIHTTSTGDVSSAIRPNVVLNVTNIANWAPGDGIAGTNIPLLTTVDPNWQPYSGAGDLNVAGTTINNVSNAANWNVGDSISGMGISGSATVKQVNATLLVILGTVAGTGVALDTITRTTLTLSASATGSATGVALSSSDPVAVFVPFGNVLLNSAGDFGFSQHLVSSQSAAPTAAVGAQSGTGAIASVSGKDTRGTLTITAGSPPPTAPAVGEIVKLMFAASFSTAPTVILTPQTANAGALQAWVSAVSTTGFSISVAVAPAASTQYKWNYSVIG